MYDSNRQSTEAGIAPDVLVELADEDAAQLRDTIIEYARQIIGSHE